MRDSFFDLCVLRVPSVNQKGLGAEDNVSLLVGTLLHRCVQTEQQTCTRQRECRKFAAGCGHSFHSTVYFLLWALCGSTCAVDCGTVVQCQPNTRSLAW